MIAIRSKQEESSRLKWAEPSLRSLPLPSSLLTGIFILLLVYMLEFAQVVLIPIVLAFFSYLVLHPIIRALERIHVPRVLGTSVTLIIVVGMIGFASLQLIDPAREWISNAPQRMTTIEKKVQDLLKPFDQARRIADEMGTIADRQEPKNRVVSIKNESFGDVLLGETQAMIMNGIIVIVLLYFLLVSGDRVWVGISRLSSSRTDGDSFMKAARNIESRLSVYLLTLTIINACTGFVIGLGMFFIGMPNPVLWGALAGLLNFVPYLGALVGEIIVAMVALFSFDSVGHALLAPLVYFLVSFVEGNFITPIILGRQLTISPILIILSMMFWGWVWGIVGLFLAVPTLMLANMLSENISRSSSHHLSTENIPMKMF